MPGVRQWLTLKLFRACPVAQTGHDWKVGMLSWCILSGILMADGWNVWWLAAGPV